MCLIALEQAFPAQVIFAPQEVLLWLIQPGGCYLHQVGGGQGC